MDGLVSRCVICALLTSAGCFEPESIESSTETATDSTGTDDPTTTSPTSPTGSSSPTSTTATSGMTMSTTMSTDPSDSTSEVVTDSDPTTSVGESESDSTGAPGDAVTIYEIQQGDVPLDTEVLVVDAVCTGVGNNGFFIQDPDGGEWSGIWVFTGMGGPFPALGDVVTVAGVYEEFFDLTEINVADGTVEVTQSPGPGNMPAPANIEIGEVAESWESVVVRLANNAYSVTAVGPMAEFTVTSNIGESVAVDDHLYDAIGSGDFPGLGVGASFTTIQGPLNYTFGAFKVAPRRGEDLTGYSPP